MPSGSKKRKSKKPPSSSPNAVSPSPSLSLSPTSVSTHKAPLVQTVDVMPDADLEEVDTPSASISVRSMEEDRDGNGEVPPDAEKLPVQQGHADADLTCLSSGLDLVRQSIYELQDDDGIESAEKIASEQTRVTDHFSGAFVVPDEPPTTDEDCGDNILPLLEADADASETKGARNAIQESVDAEAMKRQDTSDEVEAKSETEAELLIDTKAENGAAVPFEQRDSPFVGIVEGKPTFDEGSQAVEVTIEGVVPMASDFVEVEVYSEEVASVEQAMPSICIQQTEVEVESERIGGTVWGGCIVEAKGTEGPAQAELETTLEGDGTNKESLQPSVSEDEYEITTGNDLAEERVSAAKDEATEESGEDEVKVEPMLKAGEISEESMLNEVKIKPTLEAKEVKPEDSTQEPSTAQVEASEESGQEDEFETTSREDILATKNESTIESDQDKVKVEHTMGEGETREESWQDDAKVESNLEAEEVDAEITIERVLSAACTTESEAVEESSQAKVELETLGGGRTSGESFQSSVAEDESEITTGESLTEEAVIAVKGQDTEESSQGEVKVEPTLEAEVVDSEDKIQGAMPAACSTEAKAIEESSQVKVELEATLGGSGTLKQSFQPFVAEEESEITSGESLTEEAVTAVKGQDTEESSQDEVKVEPTFEAEVVDSEDTIEGAASAACTIEAEVTEESSQAKVELEATLEGGETNEESFQPSFAEDESEIFAGDILPEEAVTTTVKGHDTEESSQDEVKFGPTLEAGEKNEVSSQDDVVVKPTLEASENIEGCGQDELKVELTMGGMINEEPRQEEVNVEPIMEEGGANEETRQDEVKVESNIKGGDDEQAVWLSLVEDEAEINTGGDLTKEPILATCTTGGEVIEECGLDGLKAETSLQQDNNYEIMDELELEEVNVSSSKQEKETNGVSLQPSLAEEAKFTSRENEESVQPDMAKDKIEVATEENEHTGECLEETVKPIGFAIGEYVQPSHMEEYRAHESSETGELPDADSYGIASGQYVSSTISEDDERSIAVDEAGGRHFVKDRSEAIELGFYDKGKSSGNKESEGICSEPCGQDKNLDNKHKGVDERSVVGKIHELVLPKFKEEMVISGNLEQIASEFIGTIQDMAYVNSTTCRASSGSPESVDGYVIDEVVPKLPVAFLPNPKDALELVDIKEETVQFEVSHPLVSEAPKEVERPDSVNWQEDMGSRISEPMVLVTVKELSDEVEVPLQLYHTAMSSAVESSGILADKSELEPPLQDYQGKQEVINEEGADDSLQVIESGLAECEPPLFTFKEPEDYFGAEFVGQILENGENVSIGAPMSGLVGSGKFEFAQLNEHPGNEKSSIEDNLPSGSMFEEMTGSVEQSLKKEQGGSKREFHLDYLLPKEDKAISYFLDVTGDKEELPKEFGGGLTEAVLVTYDNGGHVSVGSSPLEVSNTVTSREVILPLACVPEKDVHVDQRSLKQEDTTRMQFPTTVMRKSKWWGCCGMLDVLLQRE